MMIPAIETEMKKRSQQLPPTMWTWDDVDELCLSAFVKLITLHIELIPLSKSCVWSRGHKRGRPVWTLLVAQVNLNPVQA